MKNGTDKTTNEIFKEHYQDAMVEPYQFQLNALNRVISSSLSKKDWVKLAKMAKENFQNKPQNINTLISSWSINFEVAPAYDEDDSPSFISHSANEIIERFSTSEVIRFFLKFILFTFDEAIYLKHHSQGERSPDLLARDKKPSIKKILAEKKRLIGEIPNSPFSSFLPDPIFKLILDKKINEELGAYSIRNDENLEEINQKRVRIIHREILNLRMLVGQHPINIPETKSKRNFENNARNYFIQRLKKVMSVLFNREPQRIIAIITNEIFEITSTTEEDVGKA